MFREGDHALVDMANTKDQKVIVAAGSWVTDRERHRDTPRNIGIGIALKRRVLALAGLGTISNVN